MPDHDHDLIARLDALGERAGAEGSPMPEGVAAAVRARSAAAPVVVRQGVPRPALAAAAAVVLVGVALVVLRVPVVPRGGGGGGVVIGAGSSGPWTVLAMTELFKRDGSVDAALDVRGTGGMHEAVVPAYRPMDARMGQLPE